MCARGRLLMSGTLLGIQLNKLSALIELTFQWGNTNRSKYNAGGEECHEDK